MSKSKYTPGPWKVVTGAIYSHDDKPIAEMVRNYKATEAGIYPVERDTNAHLIATAPEMLEALESGLQRLKELQEATGYPTAVPQILFENVIKKAKGESHE